MLKDPMFYIWFPTWPNRRREGAHAHVDVRNRPIIKVHERSNMQKVVHQDMMIKLKLQRAEAYEKKMGMSYDWFLHVRTDSFWFEPPPAVSTLRQDSVYVPDFGGYGGVNDRFAIVPRVHRHAFFSYRVDFWAANKVVWQCKAACPFVWEQWSREPNHEHNNECLLHSVMAQSRVPVTEYRFLFTIAKDYNNNGILCAVYPLECLKMGDNTCRCMLHRCKTLHTTLDLHKIMQEGGTSTKKVVKTERSRQSLSESFRNLNEKFRSIDIFLAMRNLPDRPLKCDERSYLQDVDSNGDPITY